MATVTQPKQTITAEEFLGMDLGEGSHELVRGEIVDMPPAMELHGRVCFKIGFHLEVYGHRTGYGYVLTNDTAVVTERAPDTVRGADVIFFSRARRPESELASRLSLIPPDLVVEVLSPSNRAGEILEKIAEYLNAGVLMVWIVHPEDRTVAIYRPDDPMPAFYRDTDVIEDLPELPGFRCAVSEFFI
jgi:Uma2 family endonuclease